MIGRNKSSFALLPAALAITAAIFSSATYAQEALGNFLWGGQICQPFNNAQGIVWLGGGTLNTSETRQQVVCPLPRDRFSVSGLIGVTARVVNRSDSPQEVECGIRISGPAGNGFIQETLTEPALEPGAVVSFIFANYPVVGQQSVSAECDLAPMTGVTSVEVDLID